MIGSSTDSRGKESKTLTIITVSWLSVTVKYWLAGLTVGGLGTVPPMSASEYGAATFGLMSIWLGREWTEKRKKMDEANGW